MGEPPALAADVRHVCTCEFCRAVESGELDQCAGPASALTGEARLSAAIEELRAQAEAGAWTPTWSIGQRVRIHGREEVWIVHDSDRHELVCVVSECGGRTRYVSGLDLVEIEEVSR